MDKREITGNELEKVAGGIGEIVEIARGICKAFTGTGKTSTGTDPAKGTVRADPRVIPYGTKVRIVKAANGETIYAGTIKDADPDCMSGGVLVKVYMATEQEVRAFGAQNVIIYEIG